MKKAIRYIYEKFIKTDNGENYIVTPVYDIIYSCESKFQEILICETPFGKTLFLDNILQLAEYDEEIYHKAVSLPAYKREYKDVLILGGGDGGVARELINYNPRVNITIVDIDPLVTKVMEEYFPEVPQDVFKKPNIKLLNMDAYEYVNTTKLKYDYIINDLTDIREPAVKGSQVNIFYTIGFLRLLKDILKDNGRIVYHLELYPHSRKLIMGFLKDTMKVFSNVKTYCTYIPSFGGLWMFAVFGNHPIRIYRRKIKLVRSESYLEIEFCEI